MRINRPIFVVGAPRSGTSILTWCLGQHSNIFVQEESAWLGRFAIHLEIAYGVGTARGKRSQLSALQVQREEFVATFGQTINALILDHQERLQKKIRRHEPIAPARAPRRAVSAQTTGTAEPIAFQIVRSPSDPKGRWVDGTPEYSFYIYSLRKLFPEARFIHVVREVSSVVRSMLNFERTGGPPLVTNEQQAHEYWLRTVRACRQAEQAYGSGVVCRIRYSDLVRYPRPTLVRLLEFLGESFEPACLEPLRERINSSKVPADFNPSDPATDPAVIDQAQRLQADLAKEAEPIDPDPVVAAEMEALFQARVKHVASLEAMNRTSIQRIAQLEKEVDELKANSPSKARAH